MELFTGSALWTNDVSKGLAVSKLLEKRYFTFAKEKDSFFFAEGTGCLHQRGGGAIFVLFWSGTSLDAEEKGIPCFCHT